MRAASGLAKLSGAALILAGGGGARLGGVDKAFVQLGGQPLIAHLLRRLAPQAALIAISANGNPARFAAYGLAVLPDGLLAGKGPLAGVAAGLAWAVEHRQDDLLTIPVDTPFIPLDLRAGLAPAPAVAVWQGRQHHLAALWPVTALSALLGFLATPGPHKVRAALAACAARPVSFMMLEDPFLNINTPADLGSARSRLTSEQALQLGP